MKRFCQLVISVSMLALATPALADTALSIAPVKTLKVNRDLTEEGRACITCHQQVSPGQYADWADSRHAHSGISC